jgi:hypothetical protein
MQKHEHRRRHEEEAKLLKKKSRKRVENSREYRSAKHTDVGNKVAIAFTIILKM